MKKESKARILKIIQKIWEKKQRVTYREFVRYLNNAHPSGEQVHISKQTFSRLLHEFLQEHDIKKYKKSELQSILQGTISEAINKGLYRREELRPYVTDFLRTRLIYSLYPSGLDRFIGNVAKDALRISEAENILLISDTIGKEITSLEFVKEFFRSNQYRRFLPAHEGKLGIKKVRHFSKRAMLNSRRFMMQWIWQYLHTGRLQRALCEDVDLDEHVSNI